MDDPRSCRGAKVRHGNGWRGDSRVPADFPVDAIRLAMNIAQSECVCSLHLSVCLLTDTGERAGVQPFVYEPEAPA